MKRTNTAVPAVTTSGRAWYAVGVLLLAYIFSIMDRQILTLLVGPIQQTLGANDGAYNARRDNLQKFWRNQFTHTHGIVVAQKFYEWVDRQDENGED